MLLLTHSNKPDCSGACDAVNSVSMVAEFSNLNFGLVYSNKINQADILQ